MTLISTITMHSIKHHIKYTLKIYLCIYFSFNSCLGGFLKKRHFCLFSIFDKLGKIGTFCKSFFFVLFFKCRQYWMRIVCLVSLVFAYIILIGALGSFVSTNLGTDSIVNVQIEFFRLHWYWYGLYQDASPFENVYDILPKEFMPL